jgi:protein-tyrosine-phosphatase
MIETADLVVVMTRGQKEALQIEFAEQSEKIHLLGEFTGSPALDFTDPAETGFLEADISANELFREIEKCTESVVNQFTRNC